MIYHDYVLRINYVFLVEIFSFLKRTNIGSLYIIFQIQYISKLQFYNSLTAVKIIHQMAYFWFSNICWDILRDTV